MSRAFTAHFGVDCLVCQAMVYHQKVECPFVSCLSGGFDTAAPNGHQLVFKGSATLQTVCIFQGRPCPRQRVQS